MVIRRSILLWGLSFVLLLAVISAIALSSTFSSPLQPTPQLSGDDMTATLCAAQTAEGREYVMLYDVFGTPTPIPRIAARASETPLPTAVNTVGDPQRGKEIFDTTAACNACHRVEDDLTVVGPSLRNIASVAATRVEGLTSEEYLRVSIINPNEYLMPGFIAGLMPTSYEVTLTAFDINDLIAYLLTL